VSEDDAGKLAESIRLELRQIELAGGKISTLEPHLGRPEVLERLSMVGIAEYHDVRGKVAAVADRSRYFSKGILSSVLDAEATMAVICKSIEHYYLYHMISPIADFHGTDGWNRMGAVVVQVLVERPSDRTVLDELAAALLPNRYTPPS
jgi:hypothetical protein